jgi:hypothetical protein
VLSFPYYGQVKTNSPAAVCARIWLEDKGPGIKNRKLVILGHSFGGIAAGGLAWSMAKEKLPVELMITVDPWQLWKRPPNVKRWENYQGALPVWISGIGADHNQFMPLHNHLTVTSSSVIRSSLQKQVIKMMDVKPGREALRPPVPVVRDYCDPDRDPECPPYPEAPSSSGAW